MIKYEPFPAVKPEYIPFVIKYMNRFHCVVQLTKTEYVKVKYNDIGKVCDIVARYNRNGIAGAYENIQLFFNEWIKSIHRRDYINYTFEPDLLKKIPDNIFNTYFGLKIELENHITDYNYDIELVQPLLDHMLKVFCNNDVILYNYMIKWFAHIIQKPSEMTKVAMVIKSDKQGCGKGLIIDELFGEYIFGGRSYTQVKSMEGLLGHFHGDLMNTLLVNVNEVYMTKKDANAIKTMITDPKIKIEEKYLNKIDASNRLNFALTSNNKYCVVLDEGNSDRRYFIVDCNCELANNPDYYAILHLIVEIL